MIAAPCDGCKGDSHDNCTGAEAKPCACGCLASSASLYRYSMRQLATHNQPQHEVVQRRITRMRHDGTTDDKA